MIDDRTIRAARNNAEWCDAVCRAHGSPGEFHDGIWINRKAVPRFYPNAGTIGEPSQRQLDLIDELSAARLPSGWAIKDSFSKLELASRGFRILFEAEWIFMPVARLKDVAWTVRSVQWEIVRDDLSLAQWESAWRRASGDSCEDRVFLPSLIENKDVAIVAGFRDGSIVAGAIANRSDGVVGWSNFFAPDAEMLDRSAESLVTIARVFPGLPIVGYGHGDELRDSHVLGFESLGPLRVWRLSV